MESIAFTNSKGGPPDAADVKRVRDTYFPPLINDIVINFRSYEAGLTNVGLHMTEGGRLWAAYRTFEQRLLASKSDADKYF